MSPAVLCCLGLSPCCSPCFAVARAFGCAGRAALSWVAPSLLAEAGSCGGSPVVFAIASGWALWLDRWVCWGCPPLAGLLLWLLRVLLRWAPLLCCISCFVIWWLRLWWGFCCRCCVLASCCWCCLLVPPGLCPRLGCCRPRVQCLFPVLFVCPLGRMCPPRKLDLLLNVYMAPATTASMDICCSSCSCMCADMLGGLP